MPVTYKSDFAATTAEKPFILRQFITLLSMVPGNNKWAKFYDRQATVNSG